MDEIIIQLMTYEITTDAKYNLFPPETIKRTKD